ncbi:type VI secretion system baseplate subunit TssF [Massilia sp. G4R7]|uniref:Type VI secretion system baseplate subunit TssF n=2 Tax=Massilia TaxID=149698 RepID=A0ABS8Q8E7_9BURK|nr:type VI secretion system baseplate subunit TssF [Massilia phyllostachyos]MCD2517818.1 type VI secretion system baseplate subunit TssF [Massilia phyllostachyos]
MSVDQLLPYYESELAYLRRDLREFAGRYPRIAGRLLISGEVCEDPHTERMIESFALLNARIARRLDDDYPEFTEALFEALYPHYLRPFPSCSIARMDLGGAAAQSGPGTVARGTQLSTRAVRGATCTFRTVYPVSVAPLALSAARFAAIIEAPDAARLPGNASSSISLEIALTSEQGSLERCGVRTLRVFLDGEPSFCAALRDALFMRSVGAWVEAGSSGVWRALPAMPVRPAGFEDGESLIDFPARSHAAYRLLTEYFCFPEKFNFVDIDLAALASTVPPGTRSLTLHLALSGIRSDSNLARMLGTLSPNNVLLGCTPVINLFRQRGEPIRVTHTSASYPVLGDARRAYAFEVYAIEALNLVRQTPQGESIVAFRPFYALHHAQTPDDAGHYYCVRRDEALAELSPGFETQVSIVDIDFDPAEIETDTLNVELTCTNRDLPSQLSYGQPGGDLFLEGGSSVRAISFLRKPSSAHRFARGRGAHWRLVSHLALNHLSLIEGGVEAFREMLALYDLPRSPSSQRQIGGIKSIAQQATTAWLDGNPFTCLVRGVEVRLGIDEEAFVGSGIHAFADVIARFLALYVHANSFTQLVIVSHKTGEALLTCEPRSGDLRLL